MVRSDWSHWSVQERCVGELIVEMFAEKDPSGKKEITPANIYDGYNVQLKAMWIPKQTVSVQRQKRVCEIFKILMIRGELLQPNFRTDTYYLAPQGCLYQELQTRVNTGNKSETTAL